jgi:hypothetical protein
VYYSSWGPHMVCAVYSPDIFYVPAKAFGAWVPLARIFGGQNSTRKVNGRLGRSAHGYDKAPGVLNEMALGTMLAMLTSAFPELQTQTRSCLQNCCGEPFPGQMPLAIHRFACGHKFVSTASLWPQMQKRTNANCKGLTDSFSCQELRDELTVAALQSVWELDSSLDQIPTRSI